MPEASRSGHPVDPVDPVDPVERVDALLRQGASRSDPVRFRFIEALARRARERRGASRRILDARLAQALADYAERDARARHAAGDTLAGAAARHPATAAELERLCAAGDFAALRQRAARLDSAASADRPTPLAALLADLARRSVPSPGCAPAADAAPHAAPHAGPDGELKALRYFRDTWSTLSAERQLAQALAQGPENAGPLNAHRLVLRALQLMRDVSPDYLRRFMSYADTLLWLERTDSGGAPAKKPPASAKRAI